jgi:hypothetical protein
MEKPVSEAQKIGSASEKSVWIPQTVVSTRENIVLIIGTRFSIAEKMLSAFEKIFSSPESILSASENIFSASENIFSASEKIVKIGRCRMFSLVNRLVIG